MYLLLESSVENTNPVMVGHIGVYLSDSRVWHPTVPLHGSDYGFVGLSGDFDLSRMPTAAASSIPASSCSISIQTARIAACAA